jgi:hypothetical protein
LTSAAQSARLLFAICWAEGGAPRGRETVQVDKVSTSNLLYKLLTATSALFKTPASVRYMLDRSTPRSGAISFQKARS